MQLRTLTAASAGSFLSLRCCQAVRGRGALVSAKRFHGSHGHDHEHGGMQELLSANDKGSRITIIGILANIGLGLVKFAGGCYYNSPSLLADAGHNVSDLAADAVTLYMFKRSNNPSSARFPYGNGRFETVGTLLVSGLLVGGSTLFGLHSIEVLQSVISPGTAHEISTLIGHHGHNHGTIMSGMGEGHQLDFTALGLALGSWGVKEALFRATFKIGKELNSPLLISNAWHHRSDGWASAMAVIGVGGSLLGVPIMDPLGGLVVSGMIARIGWRMGSKSLKELCDVSIDSQSLEKAINAAQTAACNSGISVHRVRGRQSGSKSLIDIEVTVEKNINMSVFLHTTQDLRRQVKIVLPQAGEISVTIVDSNQFSTVLSIAPVISEKK